MAKHGTTEASTESSQPGGLKLQRFPSIQAAFSEAAFALIGRVARASDPFLARIAEQGVPEGDILVQHTPSGKRRIDMQEVLTKISVPHRAVRETLVSELGVALVKAGRELAGQKARMLFEQLDQITSETGNVVSGRGRPGFEAIMDAFEKIEMDFDGGGPNLAMLVGADLYEQLSRAIPEWKKDPEKSRRWNALMNRKWKAYLARERSRKLVD